MPAKGLGQRVLTYQISATLGGDTGRYDLNAIVDEIITRYGFVDVDEIESADYRALLDKHRRTLPDLH